MDVLVNPVRTVREELLDLEPPLLALDPPPLTHDSSLECFLNVIDP